MSASVFGSGFGGGGGGGGGITTPVSIANGGTGQITANAAFNALAALTLGQSATFTLTDNSTNVAPFSRVLKHLSTGTTAVGFGIADAVDLQSAAGNVRRVLTDDTSLVVATDGAEEVRRNINAMVSGALQKWGSLGFLVNGNNPMLYLGDPTTPIGLCRIPGASAMQIIYSSAVMQFSSGLVTSSTRHVFSARACFAQGAAVASASTLTLGADGNYFHITGNTTINYITTTSWQNGSEITLLFENAATATVLANNVASPPGGTANLHLAGGTGYVASTANVTCTLRLDGTLGQWVETARRNT